MLYIDYKLEYIFIFILHTHTHTHTYTYTCTAIYIYIYMYLCVCVYKTVVQKVLSFIQILALVYTSHLCMAPSCTEIKTEIFINFSSFIMSAKILPQQKCSAIALLFEWSVEPFEQPLFGDLKYYQW